MISLMRLQSLLKSWWNASLGSYTIHDLFGGYSALDNMTIHSAIGYTVVVYCQKKQVYHDFDRWFIPNRIMNQYRVFSVTSADAPHALQDACQLELETDSMFPNTPNDMVQKEIAIKRYLDLLLLRLSSNDRKN